jgi:hypothetical protein
MKTAIRQRVRNAEWMAVLLWLPVYHVLFVTCLSFLCPLSIIFNNGVNTSPLPEDPQGLIEKVRARGKSRVLPPYPAFGHLLPEEEGTG